MKKLYLTIGILFAFTYVFGQQANPNVIFVEKLQPRINSMPDVSSGIEYTGTPYLDSTFIDGEFQIRKTRYLSPMRYNILMDAFEVKQGSNIVYINSYAVDTIFCNQLKFVYKKKGELPVVFAAISKKSGFDLLKQYKVALNEGTVGKSEKKSVYPSFKNEKPVYYISSTDKGLLELTGLNDFKNIFPEKADTLKSFIKEKKLKNGDENNYITIFNFVTGL